MNRSARAILMSSRTLTVNSSGATVTLSAGSTSVSSTDSAKIVVAPNTVVTYTVSRAGYVTQTNTVTVSVNTVLDITLVLDAITYTVTSSQASSTISLVASGYPTVSVTGTTASITVAYGTSVSYSVSKTGYTTQSGTQVVTSAGTTAIVLVLATYSRIVKTSSGVGYITVAYTSGGSSKTLSGTGTVTVAADYGTSVSYSVAATTGYSAISSTVAVSSVTAAGTTTITHNKITYYVRVGCDQADGTNGITMTGTKAGVAVSSSGSVEVSLYVDYGTTVTYTAQSSGYTTQTATTSAITQDTYITVTLVATGNADPIIDYVTIDPNGEGGVEVSFNLRTTSGSLSNPSYQLLLYDGTTTTSGNMWWSGTPVYGYNSASFDYWGNSFTPEYDNLVILKVTSNGTTATKQTTL